MDGASWSDDKLRLNSGESVRLTPSQVRWVHGEANAAEVPGTVMVNLPIYLNGDRSDVLFTVDLPFDAGAESLVAMRAVCLTAGG